MRLETERGEGKPGTTIDSEIELPEKRYFTTPSGLLIPEEWRGGRQWVMQHPQIILRSKQPTNHVKSANRILHIINV